MRRPALTSSRSSTNALADRDFRRFLAGHVAASMGVQMQNLAIGWELYERTGSALALGNVGLCQILPALCLWLLAGHTADRLDRRRIVQVSLLVMAACSLGLAAISAASGSVVWIYALLVLSGAARAFQQPARSALVPLLVSRDRFPSAVTWSVTAFQLASAVGPAVGGLAVAVAGGAMPVYVLDAGTSLTFCALLSSVAPRPQERSSSEMSFESLAAGIRYLRSARVVLAAISLDLFAVILGGAIALLPIYSKDILGVGAAGLGWLRAAPSLGAIATSIVLAQGTTMARAGRAMLLSVAGFGVATIVFGLSTSFALSLAMLFLTGAFDMVSVVIRHTLVQVLTPDEMRGRVSAINGLFIDLSNELGAWESGFVAYLLSPTASVVLGGVGTLVVVAVVAVLFPGLRRYGKLGDPAT
jgi:MFS family permease